MNMNRRLCFLDFTRSIVLLALCWSTFSTKAQTLDRATNTRSPDKFWRLIASSGLIAEGTLLLPESAGKPDLKKTDDMGYLLLTLTNSILLKGTNSGSTVLFNHYAKDDRYSIPITNLTALHRARVVVFLVPGDDIVTLSFPSFWFLGYGTNSIAASQSDLIERIKQELAEQNRMLAWFCHSDFGKPDQYDERVKQAVEKFFTAERTAAFRELEKLGWPAVPAMIRRLDDRRHLSQGHISLVNPAGHWEGIRHYGVDNVTQALDALLEQITRMSFGHCYNSNTRAEPISRNGWRVWLMYGYPDTPQLNGASRPRQTSGGTK